MFTPTKYYVLVGHYGSGKTELALALAKWLQADAKSGVTLVDLDIVNPYFRSAEQKSSLEAQGIEVIAPSFALTAVDVPALPADIQKVFEPDRYQHVIIDVGGDAAGATALGRYYPQIQPMRSQMQVLYVINPYRPLSANEEDISALFSQIEARARIHPDQLVNNANLQRQTTAQHLIDGQAVLQKAALRLSVPIGMVVGYPRLRAGLPAAMQELFFPLEPVMLPEWLEDDNA